MFGEIAVLQQPPVSFADSPLWRGHKGADINPLFILSQENLLRNLAARAGNEYNEENIIEEAYP